MTQARKSAMGGWLPAVEVARLLSKSTRWVRDRMKEGAFGEDVFLVAGTYYTTPSALRAFMEQRRVGKAGVLPRSAGNIVQASAECRQSAA